MKFLRSRCLLPITAPPVEDGAAVISGDRLLEVGRWSDLRRHVSTAAVDLGEVAIFPGFVNAHCHLDYTGFAGHLPPPKSFTDWIKGVLALKAEWSFSEYAASWLDGARQLIASGCTTVLDIESVPELLPEAWLSTPLRVISALEMTGVRVGHAARDILAAALARIESLSHPRNRLALAPHAPYSTRPELLRLSGEAARERGLLVTLHVAESIEEFAMFRHARGPMYEWLRGQRDVSDCGGGSPLRQVAASGILGSNCILAHMNYLDAEDEAFLAASGASVAHCPRSHDYFGHNPFPFERLRQAQVNLCLGSDSLLTVRKAGRIRPQLNFFAELAHAMTTIPGVDPGEVLRLGTLGGARAIGRAGELGELRGGCLADLVAIPFTGALEDATESVVHNSFPITASMIEGEWVHLHASGGFEARDGA